MYLKAAAGLILAASSAASAHVVIYGVDSSRTLSTLHGGDRELNRMGFLGGSSTIFTGANFLRWDGGSLTTGQTSSGWTDPIQRDVEFSNIYDANPDRADDASLYAGEAAGTGTLKEVFGPFLGGPSAGYKNMSWIVDGEDDKGYTLDLLFAKGLSLVPDNDDSTVELTVLERNGNSDFRVQGILANGSISQSELITRDMTQSTGWNLDSLEINGGQRVSGVGISLGDEWAGIVGIRILVSGDTDNGPDIVAVGTSDLVPAPGAIALLGLAAGTLVRRRRNG